jgi:hypothetical protein
MSESPESTSRFVIDKNGKIIERKKKTRLYSLGGNEPKKCQLVRMKTVGTFDLARCMEVTALACKLNTDIESIPEPLAEDVKEDEEVGSASISPKRQRHISSSDNSLTVDDSSVNSSTKKKFRSLSSGSYLGERCKSADLLESEAFTRDFGETLTTAASAEDIRNKSEENIFDSFKNDSEAEAEMRTSDDEYLRSYQWRSSHVPVNVRRRTFKKSKKIVRTDSDPSKEQSNTAVEVSSAKASRSGEGSRDETSRNISTDTVFSDLCEEEQIDLEKLESEYKEHVKSSLQREYKSDGDSLDEIGKDRHYEWRNQSVDFEFLEVENDKVEELRTKTSTPALVTSSKKMRNDSDSRTKSEGDKDTIYSKADSTETQSTEDENKIESDPQVEVEKVEKHQSLFEKRFGKLKKMNKLLKVKRFSTSALYDKRKSIEPAKPGQQPPALAALSQVSDVNSSKTSLASPKSLKSKRFQLKKRKFSFFGKSQSNNDLNINLKSLASKLSLISKSNFDLSKNSSNLRLNAVGIYSKYGSSNEHRSDIIQKQPGSCTSPLSEAFYNATGSYQLTPMELFEKFCSQDFTGLYKHEPIDEVDDDSVPVEAGNHYKGAIKKSSSLRKSTLLKQNSEPKFNMKSYPLDYYATPQEAFEEEDAESVENEEDDYEYNVNVRRSSYGRQLEFDQQDPYYEEDEELEAEEGDGDYYISENPELYGLPDEDIDEIYLMPGNKRYDGGYLRSSEEILAIDETDEEILEDEETIEEGNEPVPELGEEEREKLLELYDIRSIDADAESCEMEDNDANLKTIITEYVKNACASDSISRSKSMDLLSTSSETLKTNSNSEYAFDTVKQIHLDSCSTSRLSLSLNSDIFDDITLTVPADSAKTIQICEMDDFTLTPDGSVSEGKAALVVPPVSEQEQIRNELHSQYTIIDCDELEHDGEDDMRRFHDDKSSFAEALNKEFDKLFSRITTDSDTDITTTPSVATVLTAVKIPSRCSMDKLEALPFEYDEETIIGGISEEKEKPTLALLSQSMTTTALSQAVTAKKEDSKSKSKRSHSLGAIHKKKSNKCTPL